VGLLFGTPVHDGRQAGARGGVAIDLPTQSVSLVLYKRGDNGQVAPRRLKHPVQRRLDQATVTAVTIHIPDTKTPGARRRDASRWCLVFRGRSGGDGGVMKDVASMRRVGICDGW
jgi:hypothetical protein